MLVPINELKIGMKLAPGCLLCEDKQAAQQRA